MSTRDSTPRVLIVDDDPVSLRFLAAAIAPTGCDVVTAVDGAAALATTGGIDLLLIDRCLPDIGGVELLHALRERGVRAPAIATSAELDATLVEQLRVAGFVDALDKPANLKQIAETLRPHLPHVVPTLLDDAAALDSIGGDENALRALRDLLVRELEQFEQDVRRAGLAADPVRLGDRLHRLRAACGFCGARALAASAAAWQDALNSGQPDADSRSDAFVAVCRATASVLRGYSPGA
ncbi:MAG: response regulator [Proteobacteria bacterium]|nr:response regulator [Pseudomonadota bacterium]